ncbi:A disintegrin and metalloproteinase with thrombospondin motifs adt-2-like isoform X2 [Linepithema humile]|uniref:A disintegrin and metalloproteinase with thrombospondin motifs adt-2-like isoform X2 n=1 Tax=Linepithema humile TaxID=83485 RepID=UPI00351F4359
MFLILKLVLIILINKIDGYITQDVEITLMPTWNLTGADEEISLTLKVFGKLVQLNLRRNDQIVSPEFEVFKYNAKNIIEKSSEVKAADLCFYVHKDRISSAAINFCQEHGVEGHVILENDILEIRPLRNVFALLSFSDDFCAREKINQSFGKPHLIKRSLQHFADSDHNQLHNTRLKRSDVDNVQEEQQKVIIELAIFVDFEAVQAFRKDQDMNLEEIRKMMLEYVNHMQTYFDLPSLGATIDIWLIRLDILENQPSNLLVYNNSTVMLESFCQYAKNLNPPNDDPYHWDIGLYITAVDLYSVVPVDTLPIEVEHKKLSFTTGDAYPDGACHRDKSCAIVEFFGNEVGTSGMISSLHAVHEIGILLGLSTDPENRRDLNYIMSPERFSWQYIVRYDGDIIWSPLSRRMIKEKLKDKLCLKDHGRPMLTMINYSDKNHKNSLYEFNNSRYHGLPGRKWTAKAQCELLLRNKDANAVTLHDICQNLLCDVPNKDKHSFSGPALEGTYCALRKECRGRECVPVIEPPYNFKFCRKDNWSEWKNDSCKSNCMKKSKGIVVKRRYCSHRTHRTANCRGPYYDVDLCDDSILCIKKRRTVDEFATTRCTALTKLSKDRRLKDIGLKFDLLTQRPGRQFPHDVKKPWIACTVHCQQNQSSDYEPLRQEMFRYGVDPYFPDGTLCHNENENYYYCRQHHCVPENYSFEKSEY